MIQEFALVLLQTVAVRKIVKAIAAGMPSLRAVIFRR